MTMAVLAALFLFPSVTALPAGRGEIAYLVDLTRSGSGEVGITLSLDATESPLVLELPDEYGDGLASGLSSHVVGERALDASGAELAVRREGELWYIDHSGPLTFSYSLRLDGYSAGTPYLEALAVESGSWPYFPYIDGDSAYLPGFAVFVRPRGAEGLRPRLEIDLPAGWRAALPWEDEPESMRDLLQNPVYAGDITLAERGSLLVAAAAGAPAAEVAGLEEYADKAVSLLERAQGMLWGLDLPAGQRLLVILALRGEEKPATDDPSGTALYPSVPFSSALALPLPRDANPLSDAVLEATARGMSSLLLSRGLYLQEEAAWLREGGAWYLQDLLPYETGIWGASLFWDRFNRHYDTYRAARQKGGPSLEGAAALARDSAPAAAVLCCGGAAACAAFDAALRSLQPIAGDLPTFLRSLREMSSPGSALTSERVRAALESATGRDWSSFFREHVSGDSPIHPSSFSSLNVTGPASQPGGQEAPQGNTSLSGWVLLGVAVALVLLIPFVLEPYTMRPRKPGFLERELSKDE
ncbi:MAG: hypothetical protein H5T74_08195 [Actinobacteria bacterium]|nr:hypothetical protein [Actinomycetota bacterium]